MVWREPAGSYTEPRGPNAIRESVYANSQPACAHHVSAVRSTALRTAERRNASEPPVFGELSTGCRNHLAWAPTAAERNDAVSRPRNVV